MKAKGSCFAYEEERNRALMDAYSEVSERHPLMKNIAVLEIVVNSPCRRFWVSEERAAIVISAMRRGHGIDNMNPTRKEMYGEIYRRVMAMQDAFPERSNYDLVFDVVNSEAPKFYLTPGSALVIMMKIRKRWYEERKRKYRHLFM